MVYQVPRVLPGFLVLRVQKELLVQMGQMENVDLQDQMDHLETEAVLVFPALMVLLVSEVPRAPREREESQENQEKWEIQDLLDCKGLQVPSVREEKEESQGHPAPLDPQVLVEEKVTRDLQVNLDRWEFLERPALRYQFRSEVHLI